MSVTPTIPNRGRNETDASPAPSSTLPVEANGRIAPTPHSPNSGYPITQANDAKQHASADTAPSSSNAGKQQTHETNAGTSGEAATTPAADRKEARKNRPFFG